MCCELKPPHAAANKTGSRQGARFHLFLLLRLHPKASAEHIQQVTAIAQRNGPQLGKVHQHHRVATKLGAGDVFQNLRGRADAVVSHDVQDFEWGLGVDELGGRGLGRFR